MRAGRRHANPQRGYTLLWVMVITAVMLTAASVLAPRWQERARRDLEQDLMHSGAAYARALGSYWDAMPQGRHGYPAELGQLLLDERFVHGLKRHLRRLHPHPRAQAWLPVWTKDHTIEGVYCVESNPPRIAAPKGLRFEVLPAEGGRYAWRFLATSADALPR